jgi:pimeloyl-ACP methyl ester carboxylesterase
MTDESLPGGMAESVIEEARESPHGISDGSSSTRRKRTLPGGRTAIGLLAGALALGATALMVRRQSRQAERRHPPKGRFIEVDGVRLHYIEAGEGDPVVLVHGNGSMLEDPLLSIFGPLAEQHRVIAFDRPGFGWSERPHDREWTPEAQAAVIWEALHALGVERPVLYGHSFGAPVVVTFALLYPEDTRGIVAASGYYYPNRRADALLALSATLPIIGPVMRNTLLPVEGALFGRLAVKLLFHPSPVPESYAVFPAAMALRPWQLRAAGEDGRSLRPWAKRAIPHYGSIKVPVVVVAGAEDHMVDPDGHSRRLHNDIPGSRLHLWPATGHMVHHSRAAEVIEAIDEVFGMADTSPRVPTPAE